MQDNFKCMEFNCLDAMFDNCVAGDCCYGDCCHCDNSDSAFCETCIYKDQAEET